MDKFVSRGCSSIPQLHNAGPDSYDVRQVTGLDLPEITSKHCLFAHWAALPNQV